MVVHSNMVWYHTVPARERWPATRTKEGNSTGKTKKMGNHSQNALRSNSLNAKLEYPLAATIPTYPSSTHTHAPHDGCNSKSRSYQASEKLVARSSTMCDSCRYRARVASFTNRGGANLGDDCRRSRDSIVVI